MNEAIRRGLHQPADVPRFRVAAQAMRRRRGMDIDDIEGLLDVLDGPTRR